MWFQSSDRSQTDALDKNQLYVRQCSTHNRTRYALLWRLPSPEVVNEDLPRKTDPATQNSEAECSKHERVNVKNLRGHELDVDEYQKDQWGWTSGSKESKRCS